MDTTKVVVMKFGGTSLANQEKINHAADLIIKKWQSGYLPVVVCSASGNITDILLASAHGLAKDPSKRELDMLVSTGERISAALLSIALIERRGPAISLTGSQIGLLTTADHSNAEIIDISSKRLSQELENGKIPVVAGFQGLGTNKEITTLKRGGSDITAVFLAKALGAKNVEMYKDVVGVFSADPNQHSDAVLFDKLDYDAMYERALSGQTVLHPDCVRMAKEHGIKISVTHVETGVTGTVIC